MRPGHLPAQHFKIFWIACVLLFANAFEILPLHAQGIPNDDADVQRVDQTHIEVIDRMRSHKVTRQPASTGTAILAPLQPVKKTLTSNDANEPPPRDPPMCVTRPGIKEKNEGRCTLDA